jgi:hypothetical protein
VIGRLTDDGDDAAAVRALAELFGLPLRREHVDEVSAAWRLLQPHLARVRAIELAEHEEPAALFHP